MSDIAIRVKNLSKLYTIGTLRGRHDTLRDHLVEGIKSLFSRNRHSPYVPSTLNSQPATLDSQPSDTIWALKDVSFEVKQGEAVGVIGHNGAGKSTLLKILSRITEPTEGRAEVFGRLGSLLEVGTGFHPELSGRENIFLNGAILGMRKMDIQRKFDEIVDFSGVEKFIDTPVKRYSSGMHVRLAFAVAAHLQPEILIVDEVLAVGDAEFQQKCLGKMGDIAKEGRTVLFVSHNSVAVKNLCNKGIMLDGGMVAFNGAAEAAVDFYLKSTAQKDPVVRSPVVDLRNAPGRRAEVGPLLRRLELFSDGGEPVTAGLPIGASLTARIHFRLKKPHARVDGVFAFDNLVGQRIFHAHSTYQRDFPQGPWVGDLIFVCHIPSLPLAPGEYKIKLGLDIDNSQADSVEDATRLTIIESDYYGTGKPPRNGMFVLKQSWHLE